MVMGISNYIKDIKICKNKDLEVIKRDDCIKTLELLNSFMFPVN